MSTKKPAKSPIVRNGKEYVSRNVYMALYNFTNGSEITKRIEAGMPHIVIMDGKQLRYYFNLEDCWEWHAGGHLEEKEERAG